MKRMVMTASLLALCMFVFTGCIADKKTVIQDALKDQWRLVSNDELQKLFCDNTSSGFARNAHWKVFWSSDCRTGKLEVGPSGEIKTAFRTVEIKGDNACITNVGEMEKCYSYLEKEGKYKFVRSNGSLGDYHFEKGIPAEMQKELDVFSAKLP